jgi:hypothetical protein
VNSGIPIVMKESTGVAARPSNLMRPTCLSQSTFPLESDFTIVLLHDSSLLYDSASRAHLGTFFSA